MATTKNITMKQFNGTDYDTLYPKTLGSQITGAVPVASGGTGGTTAKAGMYNLLNGMSAITPATNDLFPFKDVSGSTSGLVTLTNLITAMGNNGVITTSNLSGQVANLGYSKIQTGSYVGTGTYGSGNPCSISLNFKPKFFMIPIMSDIDSYKNMKFLTPEYHSTLNHYKVYHGFFLNCDIVPSEFEAVSSDSVFGYGFGTYGPGGENDNNRACTPVKLTADNILSWFSQNYYLSDKEYTDSSSAQFNKSGVTYYWIAVG